MGKVFKFGLVGVGALVFLFVVAVIVGYYWLVGFLKGEGFREMVKRETGQSFQMEVDLMPLHWSGTSLYTDGLSGQAVDDNPVRQLKAEQLRANLNLYGFWEGVWDVPTIELQRLSLKLESPGKKGSSSVIFAESSDTHADGPAGPGEAKGGPDHSPTAPATAEADSGLVGLLPSEINIGQVQVQEVEVEWVPEGAPPITLNKLRVQARPRGKAWDVSGQNGVIRIPEWPEMQITDCKLRATPEMIYVTEANLRVDNQGQIKLSGEVATTEDQQMNLLAQVERLPLATLLEGDWRMRLLGNIYGRAEVTGSLRAPEGLTVSGKVNVQDGRLEALPVLNDIAVLTKYEEFRSVPLQQARADVTWSPEKLEVRNLELKSEGLLIVRGWFTQEGIQLSGKLEVATVPRALRFLPGAEEYVFTRREEGYLWTELTLSGTSLSPQEDLSGRLQNAAIRGVTDDATEAVQDVMERATDLIPTIFGN